MHILRQAPGRLVLVNGPKPILLALAAALAWFPTGAFVAPCWCFAALLALPSLVWAVASLDGEGAVILTGWGPLPLRRRRLARAEILAVRVYRYDHGRELCLILPGEREIKWPQTESIFFDPDWFHYPNYVSLGVGWVGVEALGARLAAWLDVPFGVT